MSTNEIEKIVVNKHNDVFRHSKVQNLSEVSIGKALQIGLTSTEFQEYLNIYANIDPNDFRASIVSGTMLMRDLLSFLVKYPHNLRNIPYPLYIKYPDLLKDLILNHPNTFTVDMLPTFMANDKEFQNVVNASWENEEKDSQDDEVPRMDLYYKELAEEYYKSHMSINVFCFKHQISDETYFRQYIKNLETENIATEDEINKTKKELRVIGKKIITGELPFEDYLKYYYHPKHTIELFNAALLDEADKFNRVFALAIYNYLLKSDRNVDPEKLTTLFGRRFEYANTSQTKVSGINEVGTVVKKYIEMYTDKTRLFDIPKIFKAYASQYVSVFLLGTRNYNGVTYEIDDERLDSVLEYMANHEIFIGQKTVSYYIEPVVTGAVTPSSNKIEK